MLCLWWSVLAGKYNISGYMYKKLFDFKDRMIIVTVPFMHNYSITGYNWLPDFKSLLQILLKNAIMVENRQGEGKNSGGNVEAKELISMTHGHEL